MEVAETANSCQLGEVDAWLDAPFDPSNGGNAVPTPTSHPGREFQFADCADSRPWSAEFAHRKSASWRGPLLTLAAICGCY